jgi:hypothetical protein
MTSDHEHLEPSSRGSPGSVPVTSPSGPLLLSPMDPTHPATASATKITLRLLIAIEATLDTDVRATWAGEIARFGATVCRAVGWFRRLALVARVIFQ